MSMTFAQKAHLDGVVIGSTPQDVALLDARKGNDMFRQLGTAILGMVEICISMFNRLAGMNNMFLAMAV